jgi:hypothetical protein
MLRVTTLNASSASVAAGTTRGTAARHPGSGGGRHGQRWRDSRGEAGLPVVLVRGSGLSRAPAVMPCFEDADEICRLLSAGARESPCADISDAAPMIGERDATVHALVVSVSARAALRSLRPVERVVWEDVALDAVWRNGHLVAATSARLVAEHLGVDPSTAASALRVLRHRGLVELEQHTQTGGRFGLAGYTLHLPPGTDVVAPPCRDRPHTAQPRRVAPDRHSAGCEASPAYLVAGGPCGCPIVASGRRRAVLPTYRRTGSLVDRHHWCGSSAAGCRRARTFE